MTGHALHEMGGRVVAKVGGHVADPESTVRRKVRAELVRRLVENLEIKKMRKLGKTRYLRVAFASTPKS